MSAKCSASNVTWLPERRNSGERREWGGGVVRRNTRALIQVNILKHDVTKNNQVSLYLQTLRELKPVDNCPSGKRALNKEKNRYRNVLPCKLFYILLVSYDSLSFPDLFHSVSRQQFASGKHYFFFSANFTQVHTSAQIVKARIQYTYNTNQMDNIIK